MKAHIIKHVSSILFFVFFCNNSFCQPSLEGNWEGKFMGDFRTSIEFKRDKTSNFSGCIKMFNGENIIQDDPISQIEPDGLKLTFYIPAKETLFTGELNDDFSILKGAFIFPDQSKHTIELIKSSKKQSSESSNLKKYRESRNANFSQQELVSDLNFLVLNLKKYHPNLYKFTSQDEIDSKVTAIKNRFTSGVNIVEFYTLIAPLVESVKCSHTGIRIPQRLDNDLRNYGNFFPLQLIFIEDRAYCISSTVTDSNIQPGSEMLSINNVPVHDIKQTLLRFLPTEGNNVTSKDFQLNENFNYLFNLIDNSETFVVNYKNSGKLDYETIQACKFERVNTKQGKKNNSSYFFKRDDNRSTGYLKIKTFHIKDINLYIRDMDEIFTTIQTNKIDHLILDLRGNSGGHPIFAAQLFSYLIDKKFTWFARNEMVNEFEPLYYEMKPSKLNFNGKLYVLTNGGCLSTTGHLISMIKYYTDARFIGREPGSTYSCNDFSLKIKLPNTGIEANIPKTTFTTAIPAMEQIYPFRMDNVVEARVKDYFNQKDVVIDSVYNFILNP